MLSRMLVRVGDDGSVRAGTYVPEPRMSKLVLHLVERDEPDELEAAVEDAAVALERLAATLPGGDVLSVPVVALAGCLRRRLRSPRLQLAALSNG